MGIMKRIECRYQLKELVREQLVVLNILESASTMEKLTIRVKLEDLEERAHQVGVSNVIPFLESDLFKENKFSFEESERVIIREFVNNTEGE